MIPDAWLHVYPQYSYHDEVVVTGTPGGLMQLVRAVVSALYSGEGEERVLANDGEGYSVVVQRTSLVSGLGRPFRVVDLEREAAARVRRSEWRGPPLEPDWMGVVERLAAVLRKDPLA